MTRRTTTAGDGNWEDFAGQPHPVISTAFEAAAAAAAAAAWLA